MLKCKVSLHPFPIEAVNLPNLLGNMIPTIAKPMCCLDLGHR